jgi:penicillin-binding protein 1A
VRRIFKALAFLFSVGVFLAMAAAVAVGWVLFEYGRALPDYRQLADYQPPVVTRIHAGDGRLMAEFAREKRVFVPIEVIPKRLIQAFLAAEDKNFYYHPGIDPLGIVRAALTNLSNLGSDRRPVGASTITQQVAKNFLLTNEVSIERKIKEAILAFRIEQAFTKDQILELYLNEIYLGIGSYGVAAAALNYFDKSLDELSTAEAAYLAGLPKAPSRYDPIREPEAARVRRDWVVERMLENGMISREEAEAAWAEPIRMRRRGPTEVVTADYFTEEVRRELAETYGERALYEGGLSVRTTLDPALQAVADRALLDGLVAYDQRHGWRGPAGQFETLDDWPVQLAERARNEIPIGGWRLAVVLEVGPDAATIGFPPEREGELPPTGELPLEGLTWARAALDNEGLGPVPSRPDQVLTAGNLIWVERVTPGSETGEDPDQQTDAQPYWALRQIPAVEGAVVALNPHTGRVLAMSGGLSYARSEFNRATQALRQPGSALKPFVYLAALEQGFTPSSIILDAPLVLDQGPGLGKWKPANYTRKFYGPSTLRLGVEKSRNLMTVRLAQAVGMEHVLDVAERLGIAGGMGINLASALGSGEVDLMSLTTAYAMLVNGGKRIEPALIERIQDIHGETVARRDERACPACRAADWQAQPPPEVSDDRPQVVAPQPAYQIVNILEGVVQHGTGVRARVLGKPLGGKTGTSNDSRDAWFVGFTPDLVVGVFVGFDQPKSLGRREQGASAALPIFIEVMQAALEDQPATPFRVPAGVRLVRVDADTGLLPGPGSSRVILEAFLPGTEPKRSANAAGALDGGFAGSLPAPASELPRDPLVSTPGGRTAGGDGLGGPPGSVPQAGGLY